MHINSLEFIQAAPQTIQGGWRWFRSSKATTTVLAETLAVGNYTSNTTIIEAAALTDPSGSSLSGASVGIKLTSSSWGGLK